MREQEMRDQSGARRISFAHALNFVHHVTYGPLVPSTGSWRHYSSDLSIVRACSS